jgi:protein-L-isoaspartate(D-aspartate) O-methyltransferase
LVSQAMDSIKRANFLPADVRAHASWDAALPIGFGQTNSQPSTVAMLLRWLELKEGDKVLDVGSGSGWSTALLSFIVGPKGKVYAVEKIPELVKFGRKNYEKTGLKNAEFFQAGKELGLSKLAPYDKILVSATTHMLPQSLLEQLKDLGKMVIPINDDVLEIKKEASNYKTIVHPGYVFVPLVN